MTRGDTIDAYDDAHKVYKHAVLDGKRYDPLCEEFKPFDRRTEEGKAFIQEAKENLEKADREMSDAFAPQ